MREGTDCRAIQSSSVVERYGQHCVEPHLSLIVMAYAETKHHTLSEIDIIRHERNGGGEAY